MNEPTGFQNLPELRHSGLGIASFAMSLLFGIGTFLVFVYAGIKETSLPGGVAEHSGVAMVIGLVMILMWILLLVGAVLGVAALLEKNRKKVFAVIGLLLNGGMLLLSAALVLVGMTMAH